MTQPDLTPLQEAQIEHKVDTEGISYDLARSAICGVSSSLPPVAPSGQTIGTSDEKIPGKPLQFPKSGHVRDFHDGGRKDEHRGGFASHLEGELEVPENVLATLKTGKDKRVFDSIVSDYQEDFDENPESMTSHQGRAIARWRSHIEKHYPELDTEQVNDLVRDMTEVIAIN